MEKKITLVFDIGKTHIKAVLFDKQGLTVKEYIKSNNYFGIKNNLNIIIIDKIFQRIVYYIKLISKKYSINKIIFSTHASIAVLIIDEKRFIHYPVIDYENKFKKQFEKNYFKYQKCDFNETLTPKLNDGLVLSKTLYYYTQNRTHLSKIKSILFYPQYFSWRLSGVKSSELTYLGCHSDLWSFKKNDFSTFIYNNQLQKKIPTIKKSWSKLGLIKKDIANFTNVNPKCEIYNGVHDSNACYFLYKKLIKQKFTLISTGTWIVIFNQSMKSKFLDERKEIFSKLNVFGQKISVVRFMGGREFSFLIKKIQKNVIFKKIDIKFFLEKKIFPIPSFANGGPNKDQKGKIINKNFLRSKNQLYILATLYIALYTDYCLDLIKSKNTLIIDGGFVKNKLFLKFLSILRNNQKILINNNSNGTALGTFLLCNKDAAIKLKFTREKKYFNKDLQLYKKTWRNYV